MAKTWDIEGVRTVGGVQTTVTVATVHELEYHGEWMESGFVTLTVKSQAPIDFHFGDYIIYRGEKYSITYDPNVVKKARRGTYGEGFTYDSFKMYAESEIAKTIDFKDVVLADNQQTYTSLSKFSFYADSVEDLADRLQANLNRESPAGWTIFTPNRNRTYQRVDPHVPSTEWAKYYSGDENQILGERDVNVDIADEDGCWDVLKFSYTKFGLSFFVKGKTIIIGGDPVIVGRPTDGDNGFIFRYGKNLGLYEIERTSDESQQIVTKLFAYGSETNLPLNYYANIGKKVKFTISHKSVKTDIAGHPTLSLWVDAPWNGALSEAFSPNYEPVLHNGDLSAAFHVTGSDTIIDDDGTVIDLGRKCLHFYWIMYGEQEVQDLFDSVSVGDAVYVTGVSINKMPDQYIERPADYNYPALLSINRLMLPGFPDMSLNDWVLAKTTDPTITSEERAQWLAIYSKYTFSTDKHDPWIASANLGTIGLYEGSVFYDGSQQKEIFPTIENTSSCIVQGADVIEDNGYLDGDSNIIDFHIRVMRGDEYLDWKEALANAIDTGGVYMEMKSGYCVGRKFKVKSANAGIDEGADVWILTCEREKDTSLDRYFPYYDNDTSWYCQVRQGDTFVVTGIQMPDIYIKAASEKVLIAACGYLDRRDHMRYTYIPRIDEIFMARDNDANGTSSLYYRVHAGMQLSFEDSADLGIERYGAAAPFIDQLTIKENGNNGIPTFDVVLRDEKDKGTLEKITDRISELTNPVMASTERPVRPTRDRTYDAWVLGTPYYYQTLNPVPDPVTGITYVETSYVWHNGKLWMCLRTMTYEEPGLGCQDWKCVKSGEWDMVFYDSNDCPYTNVIPAYPGSVNIPVTPKVLWGGEDVSSKVSAWQWRKFFSDGTEDVGWGQVHAMRSITITNADMPAAWGRQNPVIFECTATLPDADIEIVKSIGFN